MAKNINTPAQREKDRARIREADPIGFLIAVMRGEPIPIISPDGEVVRYDQPEAGHRLAVGKHLLDRISPALQSVKLEDLENSGAQITILAPFQLPGSQLPGALPQPAPAPPEIEAPIMQGIDPLPAVEDAELVDEPTHRGPRQRRRIRSAE